MVLGDRAAPDADGKDQRDDAELDARSDPLLRTAKNTASPSADPNVPGATGT